MHVSASTSIFDARLALLTRVAFVNRRMSQLPHKPQSAAAPSNSFIKKQKANAAASKEKVSSLAPPTSHKRKVKEHHISAKAKGDALEMRVARLLSQSGQWRVRRNITLIDRYGHTSQVDVCAGFFDIHYYECKNYSPSHPVGLEDVAKFKAVLELNGIPPKMGTVVTTSRFSPRCKTIGLKCIDGEELRAWERRTSRRRARRWVAILFGIFTLVMAGLEETPALAVLLRDSGLRSALERAGWQGAMADMLRMHAEWLRWRAERGLP